MTVSLERRAVLFADLPGKARFGGLFLVQAVNIDKSQSRASTG